MPAQKFNNLQNLLAIRTILNGNADVINQNTALIEQNAGNITNINTQLTNKVGYDRVTDDIVGYSNLIPTEGAVLKLFNSGGGGGGARPNAVYEMLVQDDPILYLPFIDSDTQLLIIWNASLPTLSLALPPMEGGATLTVNFLNYSDVTTSLDVHTEEGNIVFCSPISADIEPSCMRNTVTTFSPNEYIHTCVISEQLIQP